MRRRALHALAFLLLLLAGLTAATYWASRSEAVLRWAVSRLAASLPGRLAIEGVHGALLQPIRIDALSYQEDGLLVRLHAVRLDWSPRALLLGRQLRVQRLAAAALEVESTGPAAAPRPPQSLALPVTVHVDRLELERATIRTAGSALMAGPIALRYDADSARHLLQIERLESPWGSVQGNLEVGTAAPFVTRAALQGHLLPHPEWPLTVRGTMAGDLSRLHVEVRLTVQKLTIPLAAEVHAFEAIPLVRLQAQVHGLDMRTLIPDAPQTALDLAVDAAGSKEVLLAGRVKLLNPAAGPLDRGLLPLRAAAARFGLDAASLALDDLRLAFDGGGMASGSARLQPARQEAVLSLAGIDLKRMHGRLRATSMKGELALSRTANASAIRVDLSERALHAQGTARLQDDSLAVDALHATIGSSTLNASGRLDLHGDKAFQVSARAIGVDPAALGDFPSARLTGTLRARGKLAPDWRAQLDFQLERGAWKQQRLEGAGRLVASADRVKNVDARLRIGSSHVSLQGSFGKPGDRLHFDLDLASLALVDDAYRGQLRAQGSVGGALHRPEGKVDLSARDLVLPGLARVGQMDLAASLSGAADPLISVSVHLRKVSAHAIDLAAVDLAVDGAASAHRVRLDARNDALDLHAEANGALASDRSTWNATLMRLEQRGREPFALNGPAPLSLSRRYVAIGPAALNWSGGHIELGRTVYGDGRLASSGRLSGLQAQRLLALFAPRTRLATSVSLGARWQLSAADSVDGHLEVFRETGDASVLIEDRRVALAVDTLRADVEVQRNHVTARFAGKAQGLDASATIETELGLQKGRWGLAGAAPLHMRGRAVLRSLRPVAAMFTDAVGVDGSLSVDLHGDGTLAAPRLQGSASGDGIRIEQVGSGVFLHDGILRADIGSEGIRLRRFSVRSGEGSLSVTGRYATARDRLELQWSAERLAAIQMPDLLLVASGAGSVSADKGQITLAGRLRADKGRIEPRPLGGRRLGDDVVIAGARPRNPVSSRLGRSVIDLQLDLGDDFTVFGRGLDARWGGKLHVQGANGVVRGDGRVDVRSGSYEIYGRKLEIERGMLLFAGPLTDPGLDIRAVRKNLQVEAGVEITGTASKPQVRLVSVPDVPDMEKLSWITLGRRSDPGNHSDTEALQRYAAAMITTFGTGSMQGRIAHALGIDEISVLPGTDSSTAGGVIQVGKQLGERIYVMLEQRLSTAGNVVKINYQFARDWSLRLESGETDAVDLFYTFSFD